MNVLNYHHLYYFHVIAKTGSISKACKVLLLAQPTLSAQLSQLEKSLGVKLFDRFRQRLHLTEEGRFVLDFADTIFNTGKELQDALADTRRRGKFNLQMGVAHGTPRAFCHALVGCALKFGAIGQVRLREDRLEVLRESLARHDVDLVLSDTAMDAQSHELHSHLIARLPVLFVASNAWKKRIRKIPEDLEGVPLILPLAPSSVLQQVRDRLADWGVKPKIIAEVQDLEVVRRLVLDGHGIAPINAYTVQMSRPVGRLHTIASPDASGITEAVYLTRRERLWMNPAISHIFKTFRLPATNLKGN